jgi:hypothetical protein
MFFMVLVFGLADAPIFHDPDTAWHLATGDLIRQLHAIPVSDDWSFTAYDSDSWSLEAHKSFWYNLSWLFDILISFIFSLGGFSALYAVTVVLFAASMTAQAQYSLKHGAGIISVLIIAVFVILAVFTGTLARPNMCSIALTIAFYHLLHDYRSTGRLLMLIALPLLMVLWVNLHGGFLFAFPLIGLFGLEALVEKNWQRVKAYVAVFVVCIAATLVNPYGAHVYYGAYKTLSAPFNTYLIEWEPVKIGHNIQMTLLLLLVLCLGNFTDRRIALVDRIIAVFVIMLSLSSLRHAAIAAMLLMPYLSLRLSSLLDGSSVGRKLHKIQTAIMADMEKKDMRIMGAFMVAIACVIVSLPYLRDSMLKEPAGFSKEYFPAEEAAFVEKNYPKLRFFNSYNIGGYLDYLWRGRVKVFIDGRANSLYSDRVLRDSVDFSEDHGFGARSEMIASQYKFDGLIIANHDKEAKLWKSNPHWKLVHEGKVATIYLKQ